MKEYLLFIDGKWTPSSDGEILEDLNPATGEVFAKFHTAGAADVERAIAAAQTAFQTWGNTLAADREAILLKAADALEKRLPEFVDVLIDESGSAVGKATFEASWVVKLFRSAAGECRRIMGESIPADTPGLLSFTVRRPLGVIAGITPFNFPFLLAAKKVAFALAAGNTFVLKPTSVTPVIGLKIAELFEEIGLPPGVLNVIPGSGRVVGEKLVTDPRVRLVTFTGSTAVGKHLAGLAGRHLKRITLEMGGKGPLIILRDADLDYAVDAACFGVFMHQGQVCMAGSKVIVEEPVYEEFCEKFAAKAKTIPVGNPREKVVVGPLIDIKQVDVLNAHVNDAKAKGARVLCGAVSDGPYYQPTVLADVTAEMRVYTEESFGPLVSVIKVADSEEALRIANDTEYGLSAAVMTNDLQKAVDLSLRLQSGMVHVNSSTIYDEFHSPFGGIKDSGFGREGGKWSMEEMTELKWITIQQGKRHFPF